MDRHVLASLASLERTVAEAYDSFAFNKGETRVEPAHVSRSQPHHVHLHPLLDLL
jgi:hypothetical protein